MDTPRFRQVPGRGREDVARLKEDLVRVTQAEQSARRRIEDAEAEARRWRDRARLALDRGDDALAQQAMERALRFQEQAERARADVAEIAGHAAAVQQELQQAQIEATVSSPRLVVDVDPVADRFDQLEREAATAELDREVAELRSKLTGSQPAGAPVEGVQTRADALAYSADAVRDPGADTHPAAGPITEQGDGRR